MSNVLYLLLTVPVITAFIGWLTNWAAVKMIFHPAKFVGVGPLGWQGILYKQGEKFATGVADMVHQNLITADELASRLDAEGLEQLIAGHLEPELPSLCQAVVDDLAGAGTWEGLPDQVRQMVAVQVQQQTRAIGRDVFDEVQAMLPELIDVHGIVYKQLSGENVSRLARLTKKIGKNEFKFIEWSGAVFGFVIGLAQIVIWQLMQTWWLMPIVGAFVGTITNWLAIQMIFRPLEPKRYAGVFTYQGLFPKRQPEIARDYGESARTEILTPAVFLRMITEGENGARILAHVNQTVTARIKEEWQKFAAMAPFELTDERIARAQAILLSRVMTLVPRVRPELEAHLEKNLDVGTTVEERLAGLPKPDFERILRGIFEEDELTLILVGGFLGAAVGVAQAALVLAG